MTLTFFPSKKKRKVGVTLTLHWLATWPPSPTVISTFAKATPAEALLRAKFSNAGSMARQGEHAGDVKKTHTQRWDVRRDVNDAGFVVIWRDDVSVDRGGVGTGVG